MKHLPDKNSRPGAALLVVLFVVMAITLVSLGFLSRSDMELACGRNFVLRMEMDYLAQSGLTHAKALVINPDNPTPLVGGQSYLEQQLLAGGDYYDLAIMDPVITDPNIYTYAVQCQAYRMNNGEKTAQSTYNATLSYDHATLTAYYKSIER